MTLGGPSTKSLRDRFLGLIVVDLRHGWRLPIEGAVVLVEVILAGQSMMMRAWVAMASGNTSKKDDAFSFVAK